MKYLEDLLPQIEALIKLYDNMLFYLSIILFVTHFWVKIGHNLAFVSLFFYYFLFDFFSTNNTNIHTYAESFINIYPSYLAYNLNFYQIPILRNGVRNN